MRLETERLIVRDYEENDREAYFRLKNNPRTMYYLQDIYLSTREGADADFHKVLEFAFLEDQVYRVTTGCLADNIGSEKVMIKCGLIKEAEHVDWEWHDGRMKTRLEYRLLKSEWDEIRFGKR